MATSWRSYIASGNKMFYVNEETKEKTWVRPEGFEEVRPPTPPPTPPEFDEPDTVEPAMHEIPKPVTRKRQAPVIIREGETAEFTSPTGTVLFMMDGALAPRNALPVAFDKVQIIEQTCFTHGAHIWLMRQKALFKDYDKFQPLVFADLMNLKTIPILGLVREAKVLMLRKWRVSYKESAVADAWSQSYFEACITRVEANEHCVVQGGKAADNNAQEGKNYAIKKHVEFTRAKLLAAIDKQADFLRTESVVDISWKSMNSAVNSVLFYRDVKAMVTAVASGIPCQLNVSMIPPARFSFPLGTIIIASEATLQDLKAKHAGLRSVENFKTALFVRPQTGRYSWFEQYAPLHSEQNAASFLAAVASCEHFDGLIAWANAFYVLKPITSPEHIKILRSRLTAIGLRVLPLEETIALGASGLCSCNCAQFLHYAWCKHACSLSFSRRIITKYPKNKDPTALPGKKLVGRPPHARPKKFVDDAAKFMQGARGEARSGKGKGKAKF